MNQVSLNAVEMKDFLKHIISNNRYIQKQGKVPVSTEILGDSGLGKTSIALQLAKEEGLNFVKLNLAQIEELGDLIGFPVRQFELSTEKSTSGEQKFTFEKVEVPGGTPVVKKIPVVEDKAAGQTIWADENAVDEYVKRGFSFTGRKRMSYCPPEWIADKQGGGILILDDWNRADLRFIQAVMELVDRQEYISWKLPEDWHIILTANPDNGEYLVNTIDTAQRTRFVSTELSWDADCWAEWAEKSGIDGRCINFVLKHGDIVNARVNPRSLTTFFNCISSFTNFQEKLGMVQMIGEGSVGPETAILFTMFIKNRLDLLISPKDMLLKTDQKQVIDMIRDNIMEAGNYRADIASILTTRLVNFAVMYADKNPITPENIKRLQDLIKEENLFTDDLKYILVKKLLSGNKQKFQKMVSDPVIQDYVTK